MSNQSKQKTKDKQSQNEENSDRYRDVREKLLKLNDETRSFIYNRTLTRYQSEVDVANTLRGGLRFRLAVLGVLTTLFITAIYSLANMDGIFFDAVSVFFYIIISILYIINIAVQYQTLFLLIESMNDFSELGVSVDREEFNSDMKFSKILLQIKDFFYWQVKIEMFGKLNRLIAENLENTKDHINLFVFSTAASTIALLFANLAAKMLSAPETTHVTPSIPFLVLTVIVLIVPLIGHKVSNDKSNEQNR